MSRHAHVFLAALLAGCSVSNPDHCGNREGDATCVARDANYPYCSLCVGENEGCVASPSPSPHD